MWLFIGLAVYFWPWVLGAAVVLVLVLGVRFLLRVGREELEQRRRRREAIAARADQQHGWILDGDERGLYGEYPPAA